MPTLDDALSKMAGAKYFSKLDAKSGYWQMKLNEESSYLTTFNTPFGRYRFCRLPFGIVSSQDEFQRKMDEIFEDLPGTTPLVDDVIVHGKTQEEHDQNLRAALDRAASKHLTLSPEKLTVRAEEISYLGHILTADGLKPDPGKVKAIVDMVPPPPPPGQEETPDSARHDDLSCQVCTATLRDYQTSKRPPERRHRVCLGYTTARSFRKRQVDHSQPTGPNLL